MKQIFNFERFRHHSPAIQKLVTKRVKNIRDFSTLRMLHTGDDLSAYQMQELNFEYPAAPDQVWESFFKVKPNVLWQGPMLTFLFAYSAGSDKIYYFDDKDVPLIHEGMQIYCCIDIFGPRMIVGLGVIKLDASRKKMELGYLEGGIYNGVQQLTFMASKGQTRVNHKSYFKGLSLLPGNAIYKYFHRQSVSEFHQQMKKLLLQKGNSLLWRKVEPAATLNQVTVEQKKASSMDA